MQPQPTPILNLPPELLSMFTVVFGLLGTICATLGITIANLPAIESALEYLMFGGLTIAGLVAHTHIHSKRIAAAATVAASAATVTPAAPSMVTVAPSITIPVAPASADGQTSAI